MVRSQDTVAAANVERPQPARPVFVLESSAATPAGEAAEWLLAIWQSGWNSSPPGLILVDQRRHSAVVEHIHRRFQSLPALSIPQPNVAQLADVVRAALDGGATLIAGGSSPGPGLWQPALFVNLRSTSPLLQPLAPSGALLAVMRTTSGNPAQNILSQLVESGAELDIHRPAEGSERT